MPFADIMGRVAIVTGGAGSLGKGVTQVLREAGATVVVVDAHAKALDEMRHETQHSHLDMQIQIVADLTNEADAQRVVDETMTAHGRIEIVCNLVGGYAGGTNVVDTEVSHLADTDRQKPHYCLFDEPCGDSRDDGGRIRTHHQHFLSCSADHSRWL